MKLEKRKDAENAEGRREKFPSKTRCVFEWMHLETVASSLSPPKRGEGWGEGILF